MALPVVVEDQWRLAQLIEQELKKRVKQIGDPLFEGVEYLTDQLRIDCERVIFLDFDYACTEKVEQRLWDSHSLINSHFRKLAVNFKTRQMEGHIVEKRKWDKQYVDFLKKSQFFYKGYIQRLASHFGGLPELPKIAHRLELDTLTVDERILVPEGTAKRILHSCHFTLLRLGDLSRYRNAIRTKDKSWDKALAYYGLANDLCPDSGNAFNQMAVISLSEGDHLNAVYYLYRALAVKEPIEVAEGNLVIEFRKIDTEWHSGGRKNVPGGVGAMGRPASSLIIWFSRLHAKLFKGKEFSSHDELENEVLGQLTVLLKEQSLEGVLEKFVLINIAAEYFAAEKLRGLRTREHFQSYYFFLRLNIRTLFMFLQILQTELAGSNEVEDAPDVTGNNKPVNETITAVTRRILPSIRQYSTWLVSSAVIISNLEDNSPLNIHIKELWSIYCSTLTLLVAAFPPENLPSVDYLLEEDADTVGFIPLRDPTFCDPYTDENGLKPRTTDPGIERQHPNIEMMSRVRDLLRDAMLLSTSLDKQKKKIAPIAMIRGDFHFLEEGIPSSRSTDGNSRQQSVPALSSPVLPLSLSYETSHLQDARPPSITASDSHQSMGTDMYRMVDDLLAPSGAARPQNDLNGNDESSYGMHSSTVAEVFAPAHVNVTARPTSRHSGTPFTSLPGVFSAFSPQPGELDTTSPDAALRLPSFHRSKPYDHPPPDQSNSGFDSLNWGAPKHANDVPTQRQVSEQLQQSLAQQYGLPSSPNFSQPSSLYVGTPNDVPRRYGDQYQNIHMNSSTRYAGGSDFERSALLQSSIWDGSQPVDWTRHVPTPPGGQGG